MKKTRRGKILLILLAVTFLFSGCGGQTGKEAATNEASQTAPVQTGETGETESATISLPITEDTVNFTFWTTQNPQANNYLDDLSKNDVYIEMEKRTNVHLDMKFSAADSSSEKFGIMIASGDIPDIVVNGINYYKAGADASIDDGIFLRLNEMVEESIPNYSALIEKYDVKKEVVTDSGNMVSFYGVRDTPRSQKGAVIRQDMLDSLGLDVPSTIDDFTEVLTALHNEYGTTYGLDPSGVTGTRFVSAYGVLGNINAMAGELPFYVQDETVKYGPMEEGFKEYLTQMHSWWESGLIYDDFMNASGISYPSDIVTSGKVCIWDMTQSSFHQYDEAGKSADPDFKLTALTEPVLNEGDVSHFADIQSLVASEGWNISASCENLDVLCKYLNYWYSNEGSLLASYGIEDKSFNYGSDGKPHLTELITNNPEGIYIDMAIYVYCIETGPFEIAYSRSEEAYTDEQIAASETWQANRDSEYSIPDITMTDEEGEMFNSIMGDVTTLTQESTLKFIIGAKDLSEFDEFVTDLKSLGIEDAIDIEAAALERYNNR